MFPIVVNVQVKVLDYLTIRLKDIWARDEKKNNDDNSSCNSNDPKVRGFVNDVTHLGKRDSVTNNVSAALKNAFYLI